MEIEEKICVKQKSKMDKSPKRVTRQLVSVQIAVLSPKVQS